jgi:hypothetical protein
VKDLISVIGLKSWTLPEHRLPTEGVRSVSIPAEAVDLVDQLVRGKPE